MNTLCFLCYGLGIANLHALLISFLVMLVVIAVVGGLLWCINKYVAAIPPPVMTIIAVIMALLVLIWAVSVFAPV